MLLTIDNGWMKEKVYYDTWRDVILIQEKDVTGHTSSLERVPIFDLCLQSGLKKFSKNKMLQGSFF